VEILILDGAFVTTAEGAPVIMEVYSIPSGIYQNNNL